MSRRRFVCRLWVATSLLVLTLATAPAPARDAAFMDPGTSSGGGAGDEAVRVEPKGDIDTGESVLNVARRTTLFFANTTGLPIKVEKIAVNGDGNVASEITNDDCSKQGEIHAQSRCSVEVSVTPSSSGPWSIDVLLTHNGAGRIARAKLTGKTTGTASNEKRESGLALSTKEVAPVNFGEVEVGQNQAVRSALMVNDSADVITLYAIDVIKADNGLERLDQGCAIDMELKPGESCPVTLVWTPVAPGQISTDLIIRHSGRAGFSVVPIRGNAKGHSIDARDTKADATGSKTSLIPAPPTAQDLEKATTGKIAPLAAETLAVAATPSGHLRLIGTVGNRAVLLLPDGTTGVASKDDEITIGDKTAKIVSISAKSAELLIDGKKKTLILESAPELIARTASRAKDKDLRDAGRGASDLNGPNSYSANPVVSIPAVTTLPQTAPVVPPTTSVQTPSYGSVMK